MRAKKRTSRNSWGQKRPASRFSKLLRRMPSKLSRGRRMNSSVRAFRLGNSSGLRNSIGLSVQKVSLSFREETRIRMSWLWRGIWNRETFTCTRTTEEPPRLLSRSIARRLESLGPRLKKPRSLQSVDRRPGTRRSCQEPGGFIMIRSPSQLQQASSCPQALSWLEAREISSSPTVWKWGSLSCSKSTKSRLIATLMIAKFIRKTFNKRNQRFKKAKLNSKWKRLKSLPSLVFKLLQKRK